MTDTDATELTAAERARLLRVVAERSATMRGAQATYDQALEERTAAADQLVAGGVPYTHIGDAAGVVRQVITKQVTERRARQAEANGGS